MNQPTYTQHLRIHDVALYLRKTGWQKSQHPNIRLLVFQHLAPPGSGLKIVLASSDDFEDSAILIANAVTLLAELQGVPASEMVRAIHAIDRDILNIRFLGTQASSGGLPLDAATKLVSQLRDLLSYAACVEENPRPYFLKATSIGRKYTESCLFGHTFPGSFGFTVESPTGLAPIAESEEMPQPFERRVVSRIMRGIGQLQDAVLCGDTDSLVTNFKSGLNANLCELLEETLKQAEDTEIEYSVTWSPEWPVAADLLKKRSIRLDPSAAAFLGAAARQLRRLEESRVQTLIGRIVALQSEASVSEDDGSDDPEQVATILWEENRGRRLRIRVALEPSDYSLACDAHKRGIQVQVTGVLEKVGKFWKLMAPTKFETLLPLESEISIDRY